VFLPVPPVVFLPVPPVVFLPVPPVVFLPVPPVVFSPPTGPRPLFRLAPSRRYGWTFSFSSGMDAWPSR
jgi:hypothetical protein